MVAVLRTTVSPARMMTAPLACSATRPVSIVTCRPATFSCFVTIATYYLHRRGGPSLSQVLEGEVGAAGSSTARLQGPDPETDLRPVVLPPDPELRDQSAVALDVVAAQVVEQAAPLPDQEKKATAGVMIL